MRKGFGIILLLFISKYAYHNRIYPGTYCLIGDAGELKYGRAPVVDAARDLIPMNEKTTVIYLGDNFIITACQMKLCRIIKR